MNATRPIRHLSRTGWVVRGVAVVVSVGALGVPSAARTPAGAAFCASSGLLGTAPDGAAVHERAVGAIALVLLTLCVLLLLAVLGTFIFVRAARRNRAAANRQRPASTAAEDVWAMHKLPDDLGEHDGDLPTGEP